MCFVLEFYDLIDFAGIPLQLSDSSSCRNYVEMLASVVPFYMSEALKHGTNHTNRDRRKQNHAFLTVPDR
jgi:hypothetical protein